MERLNPHLDAALSKAQSRETSTRPFLYSRMRLPITSGNKCYCLVCLNPMHSYLFLYSFLQVHLFSPHILPFSPVWTQMLLHVYISLIHEKTTRYVFCSVSLSPASWTISLMYPSFQSLHRLHSSFFLTLSSSPFYIPSFPFSFKESNIHVLCLNCFCFSNLSFSA